MRQIKGWILKICIFNAVCPVFSGGSGGHSEQFLRKFIIFISFLSCQCTN
jgi:hypothetical protein